jgi:RNA polymerase sigma-70 factor, ECF subfamily
LLRAMSAFATLAPVYSMPAASPGDVDLSDASSKARARALNLFLASVELKAFKMAVIALRHEDDALDAVQDAMFQLARKYGARPEAEWKPLFYRILENRIHDVQRRRMTRNKVIAWLPWRRGNDEDDDMPDLIEQAASPDPAPVERLEINEAIEALERAVNELPRRQQQAFLLRNLEGMDVAQTAAAMGCSEGSVKTHYFRALTALREKLGNVLP